MPTSKTVIATTAERDQLILDLALAGKPPREIGPQLGLTRGYVSLRLYYLRTRKGRQTPMFDGHGRMIDA